MNDIFCSACGEKNKHDSNFCTKCGAKIEVEKTVEKVKPKEISPKSNSLLVLGIGFVFSIIVIAFVYESNHSSIQEKKEPSSVQNKPQDNPELNKMMLGIQELRKALNENPESYELNVKMANSFFDIGRFPQAIQHYRTALKVNDTDPNVLIDLGVAFFNTNSADSALNYINKALKINPNHPQGLYNSGIVHINLGDSSKAVMMWERLIETSSQSPQAETAKKFIDQLKSKITKS